MTKLELAKQLAQAEGIAITRAQSIVDNVMDLIICHFQDGGSQVTLRGFGTIKIRKRHAHRGVNPKTGEVVEVAEKMSITFKPAADFLHRIN